MRVEKLMDLGQLMELMGSEATEREAELMRQFLVDDDYYEDLDYDRTVALIEALKRGERPKPGSTIGRQTSAPEGGPLTLTQVPGE